MYVWFIYISIYLCNIDTYHFWHLKAHEGTFFFKIREHRPIPKEPTWEGQWIDEMLIDFFWAKSTRKMILNIETEIATKRPSHHLLWTVFVKRWLNPCHASFVRFLQAEFVWCFHLGTQLLSLFFSAWNQSTGTAGDQASDRRPSQRVPWRDQWCEHYSLRKWCYELWVPICFVAFL